MRLRMSREAGVNIAQAGQCIVGLKTLGANRSQLVPAKNPIMC